MKNIVQYLEKNAVARHAISLLVLVVSYFRVLGAERTVNPDAQLIMPIIERIGSVKEYFHVLLNLEMFDIQPIRDLTLFIDWWFFSKYSLNVAIIQNVLFWYATILVVERLLQLLYPTSRVLDRWIMTLLFSIYPLFCATLSWGIARKHILATLFIALATYYYLLDQQAQKKRNGRAILYNLFYFFSIFSQPITLLWPFWIAFRNYLRDRKLIVKEYIHLVPSFVIFAFCTFVNWYYYENSAVFRMSFESKTADALNISDKILGLGHYVFQSLFPYQPSIFYELGHWSVLVGLVVLVLALALYLKSKLDKIELFTWGTFFMFPLVIVLTNPHILSDNYLLVPTIGLFILLFSSLSGKMDFTRPTWFGSAVGLLLFWSGYTYKESKLWLDPLVFSYERNYVRRPNCSSALNLARKSYALGRKLPEDTKHYLEKYDCFQISSNTPAVMTSQIYLQTYILYYETDLPIERRIEALKKYADIYYYSKLVLASMYLKNNNEGEALRLIHEVYAESSLIKWAPYYDLIMAQDLEPYCKRVNSEECLSITSHFTTKKELPYM